MKQDLDRIEQTAKRADEDAGYALDAKERYLQKEAELDAGIEAMDTLVALMASGDAEITEDGVAMTNTPPFFTRLFGPKPTLMQRAVNDCFEPTLPTFRIAAKVRFRETGKLSLENTGQIGPSTEVVALEYCFPKVGTRRDQRCVTSLTRTVRAQNLAHLF